MNRLLDHFGKVFNFVKSDLVDKFQNLDRCIKNDVSQNNYETIQSSINYEKSLNIFMMNQNATLSILRLIRGLDFLRKFLENLHKNKDNNKKTPELAGLAYEQTLSFRHKWAVRKIVKAGLYMLPYKSDLIRIMSSGIDDKKELENTFTEFLALIDKIYGIIHKIYEENNFLELVLA